MKFINTCISVSLLALLAAPALAEVEITDAYVRGLPPGVSNTSAYMTLHNEGDTALVLTGATSPVAGSIMLHTSMNHNGMIHMEHVQSASIAPHAELKLESGGLHLMLMDIKQNPQPRDTVALTLQFADGTTQSVQLQVRSVLDE